MFVVVVMAASRKDALHQLLPDIAQVRCCPGNQLSLPVQQVGLCLRGDQSFRCANSSSNVQVPIHGSFSPDALRACIRANFAAGKDASVQEQGPLLDRAFAALRILSEQMHMQQCSSHAVTGGIQVEVTSAFIGVNTFLNHY